MTLEDVLGDQFADLMSNLSDWASQFNVDIQQEPDRLMMVGPNGEVVLRALNGIWDVSGNSKLMASRVMRIAEQFKIQQPDPPKKSGPGLVDFVGEKGLSALLSDLVAWGTPLDLEVVREPDSILITGEPGRVELRFTDGRWAATGNNSALNKKVLSIASGTGAKPPKKVDFPSVVAEQVAAENEDFAAELVKAETLQAPAEPVQPTRTAEHTHTAASPPGSSLLDKFLELFDSDVLEIFGQSGCGKTRFCQHLAETAAADGKTVLYIDTEKNLSRSSLAKMEHCTVQPDPSQGLKQVVKGPGLYYCYTPKLSELISLCRDLPKADLAIIDSLGMPVLIKYSRMSQREQGVALQEMIAIKGDLKEWCYDTGGLAINVNQPVSEMNKTPTEIRDGLWPFGDKSGFATKSTLRFVKESSSPEKTVISALVHKARDMGDRTKVFSMSISNAGVEVRFQV